MAKAVINKHIDDVSELHKSLFVSDIEKAKGEIIICNDDNNPSIYITNNSGNMTKIAGGGGSGSSYDDTLIWKQVNENTSDIERLKESGSSYDDTQIWEQVNENKAEIENLKENVVQPYDDTQIWGQVNENKDEISQIKEDANTLTNTFNEELAKLQNADNNIKKLIGNVEEGKSVIDLIDEVKTQSESNTELVNENKNIVDNYTINNKKISESPVIDSDDLLINDNYSMLKQTPEFVVPGDILTDAISKLEIMLANTTLALTAAINDLDKRIGTPTVYDENGAVIKEGSGLIKRIENLEKGNINIPRE